ncbi:hypothetical protein F5X99DRAFT_161506 [Biscogniauxia marginata]|nr:hypothetical protein F5X99DRAFT_161506 [Biscogniauxia marginata]
MKFNLVALLFSLSALSAAQDLELDDVPRACQQVCQDIANLTSTCDQQNDDDNAERTCICNANNAQSQATSCAACAKANGQNDNDSDIAELMRDCNWNYADVVASSASAVISTITSDGSAILSTITAGAGGVVSTITSDGSAILSTITSDVGGVLSTITSNGGEIISTIVNGPTSTDSPDAAPMATAGVVGVAAGLMIAALPVVL